MRKSHIIQTKKRPSEQGGRSGFYSVTLQNSGVGRGKKSMAFSLTYRAADRTLTSEEVEKAHSKLVTKVCKSTGGEVRS